MTDKTDAIGGIIAIMKSCWDLPADCNEGELFTYAEVLFDRIQAGDNHDALYAYLADVQTNKLEMPPSDAYRGDRRSFDRPRRNVSVGRFDLRSWPESAGGGPARWRVPGEPTRARPGVALSSLDQFHAEGPP